MGFLTWKNILRVSTLSLFALFVFILATNVGIYLAAKPYIYDEINTIAVAEVALIPGAAVSTEGEISPIFLDRVDAAIRLYTAQKVSKILVSGDNSTLEYNEVNPVRLYLLEKGVLDQDIFLDHAGFDTYSTMYRAREVFVVNSVIIVTQSFHLPRAIFIARTLGLEATGLNADIGNIFKRNYVREIFANEKTLFDVVVGREPKFLGEPIPISGDGRNR